MKLDPAQLRTLSGLLDDALDLPEEEQRAWLDSLGQEFASLKPLLEQMLARRDSVETGDLIDTLPQFDLGDDDVDRGSDFSAGAALGPYRLLRELGRGGMGEVWLAERSDGLVRRPVALKLPAIAGARRSLAERFTRECEILAPLTHPHIARLYDVGFTADGQPYLALEYVEGATITAYCDEQRLDLRARVGLFLQVLEAVQYAHSNLILHRDLKPSNILVTPAGEVKLLDFGIAKLMTDGSAHETELTQLGGRALTLDYASPEQIVGAPLTTASDVYSLGVVLYELLAAERPYRLKRGTRGELEEAIAAADPVAPSRAALSDSAAGARATSLPKLRRALAGDLDTIVLKALRKDSRQRYPAASALADDLQRNLSGLPILARPTSTWYRATRFVRRHAVAVAAASVVAVALVAAAIVSLTLMQRAEQAAATAKREASVATAEQGFLTDLFRANTVEQHFDKQTRDLTAAELLDRGALTIDSSLDDAPAAKASLLQLMGQMYEELGLNDRSLAMHEKSVKQAAKVYGEDSREFALALLEKAWVSNRIDKSSDAPREMIERAKRILAAKAPDSEDYAEALYMESHVLQSSDAARAVAAGEEAVRIIDRLGATDKRAAFARTELGISYRAQGNLAKATSIMLTALAEYERLYGTDYPDVAFLHEQLGVLLRLQLRLAEAEDHLRRAVAIYEKYPFQRRRGVAVDRFQLGALLAQRGRYAEAYAECEAAKDARTDANDGYPLAPQQVRVGCGALHLAQGDGGRGISEIEAAFADPAPFGRRSILPAAAVNEYLAGGYLQVGDLANARAATDRALDLAAKDGVPPIRAIWIALRDAEVTAREGNPQLGLQKIDDATRRYPIAASNASARMDLALSRARILSVASRPAEVVETLAPWLDRPLDQGIELPPAVRGEMQLLAGEALAASSPAAARRRLIEAETTLAANDVPSSLRLKRVRADLARLPG
jgi:serine/threonine protein kinase